MFTERLVELLTGIKDNIIVDTGQEIRGVKRVYVPENGKGLIIDCTDEEPEDGGE